MNRLDHMLLTWLLRRIPAQLRVLHALSTGTTTALSIGSAYSINIGTIYVHLARLEHSGQVTSWWLEDGGRVYALVPNWTATRDSEVLTPEISARLDHLIGLRALARL
ncbi:hypothetical protein GO986_18575 [Deinococcus sp. HMF7620]|uniref:ArsR family transcriptional regulator n=1 Tax=Deinococcus arboris TaxID=2682977 RepID=A0A7C9HU52_9DEIO|nr:hypothetical protein [Deinococcus arboris]MVN88747.1 hypothetical protein [Deinococcus arboris]